MTCSESPDVLSGDSYNGSGDEMRNAGLYVDVAPWTCHVLRVLYGVSDTMDDGRNGQS